MAAPLPSNEAARLKALQEYSILETGAEQAFDDIARLASFICRTPIALITIIDESRQWFKAKIGVDGMGTTREDAFCAHAILTPSEMMVVPDATIDERFHANPHVIGDPHVRFYAGVPLVTPTGEALGTLCVIDRKPRELDAEQVEVLQALARQVIAQMELRRSVTTLEGMIEEHERHVVAMEEYQRSMEESQAALEAKSATDGLTGIANRRAFDARLDEELSRSHRGGIPVALALLDVDSFKKYNDSFGHGAGDEVLVRVASIMKECARPYDFTARYGGEEFALILPGTTREGAMVVAERIRRTVQRAVWPQRPVTVSIGVAVTTSDITSAVDLLRRADQALYASKESGRNRVSVAKA